MFFSHAKICLKIGSSKWYFRGHFWRFFGTPASNFIDFGSQNGSPEHHVSMIFLDCGLASIFDVFFLKKRRKAKTEKVDLDM